MKTSRFGSSQHATDHMKRSFVKEQKLLTPKIKMDYLYIESVVLRYPDSEAWANSNVRFSLAEFLLGGALAAGLPEGLRQ